MRHIFEQLKSEGASVIAELVAARAQEGVQLDFKEKTDASSGGLNRVDRQVLGRALSAMANSMGGLLIYGVVAKRDTDNIDAASAPAPISELRRFKSEVTRAVGELLSPTHDGIEVVAIPGPSPDVGYLAIWIERSERRPHMSEAKDDKHYWKRAGDQTFIMEHYDVEDAFKRLSVAKLGMRVLNVRDGGYTQHDDKRALSINVTLGLINESSVTALYPYVGVANWAGCHAPPSPVTPFMQTPSHDWLLLNGRSDTVVHPGLAIPTLVLRVKLERWFTRSWEHDGRNITDSGISFDYQIGCKDSLVSLGRFEAAGPNFVDLVMPSILKRDT